jgi:hypothetical protein
MVLPWTTLSGKAESKSENLFPIAKSVSICGWFHAGVKHSGESFRALEGKS